MKRFLVVGTLSLLAFFCQGKAAVQAPFPIQPLAKGSDGFTAKAWENVPAMSCDGEQGFTSSTRLLYDDEAFYLRSDIIDDTQIFLTEKDRKLSDLYLFDSVEFWFGRHQFSIGWTGQELVGYDYLGRKPLEGIKGKLIPNEKGYSLVARIPWKSIGVEPRVGELQQFSLWFNDVDGEGKAGRKQYRLPAEAEWDLPVSYGAVFFNRDIPVDVCSPALRPLFLPDVETRAFQPINRLFLKPVPGWGGMEVAAKILNGDKERTEVKITLAGETVTVDLPLPEKPGIETLEFYAKLDGGRIYGPVTLDYFATTKALLSDYKSEQTPPADLDAFWDKAVAELAATPLEIKDKQLVKSKPGADLWKATLIGWQGVPIEAYLSIPKAEGKFPIDINVYPATGIDPDNVPMSGGAIHLRVSPRGFGTHDADRKPKGSPYVTDDPDPRNFYVLANVLDWMRGLDWALSQEKADPNRVFLGGGSRGGYLTMMFASADPRISVANAAVPCYADLELMARLGYSSAAADAYHALYGGSKERQESMRKVWGYFDVANVAHRIKCPIVVEAGMTDEICPAPGIVDAFNRISSEQKFLFLNPEQGHTGTRNGGHIRNMLKERAAIPSPSPSQP